MRLLVAFTVGILTTNSRIIDGISGSGSGDESGVDEIIDDKAAGDDEVYWHVNPGYPGTGVRCRSRATGKFVNQDVCWNTRAPFERTEETIKETAVVAQEDSLACLVDDLLNRVEGLEVMKNDVNKLQQTAVTTVQLTALRNWADGKFTALEERVSGVEIAVTNGIKRLEDDVEGSNAAEQGDVGDLRTQFEAWQAEFATKLEGLEGMQDDIETQIEEHEERIEDQVKDLVGAVGEDDDWIKNLDGEINEQIIVQVDSNTDRIVVLEGTDEEHIAHIKETALCSADVGTGTGEVAKQLGFEDRQHENVIKANCMTGWRSKDPNASLQWPGGFGGGGWPGRDNWMPPALQRQPYTVRYQCQLVDPDMKGHGHEWEWSLMTEDGCWQYDCDIGDGTMCAECRAQVDRTSHHQCTKCNPGHNRVGNKCVAFVCDEGDDEKCKSCTAQEDRTKDQECLDCNPGYMLDEGQCKPYACAEAPGTQCKKCLPPIRRTGDNQCLTCNGGHHLSEGWKCNAYHCDISDDPNATEGCKSCVPQSIRQHDNHCLTCRSGYSVTEVDWDEDESKLSDPKVINLHDLGVGRRRRMQWWKDAWDAASDWASDAGDTISDGWDSFTDTAGDVIDDAGDALEDFGDATAEGWENFKDAAGDQWDDFTDAAGEQWVKLQDWLAGEDVEETWQEVFAFEHPNKKTVCAPHVCGTGVGRYCKECKAPSERLFDNHCKSCNAGYKLDTTTGQCEPYACDAKGIAHCEACEPQATRTKDNQCRKCSSGYHLNNDQTCSPYECDEDDSLLGGIGLNPWADNGCTACVSQSSRKYHGDCKKCNIGFKCVKKNRDVNGVTVKVGVCEGCSGWDCYTGGVRNC